MGGMLWRKKPYSGLPYWTTGSPSTARAPGYTSILVFCVGPPIRDPRLRSAPHHRAAAELDVHARIWILYIIPKYVLRTSEHSAELQGRQCPRRLGVSTCGQFLEFAQDRVGAAWLFCRIIADHVAHLRSRIPSRKRGCRGEVGAGISAQVFGEQRAPQLLCHRTRTERCIGVIQQVAGSRDVQFRVVRVSSAVDVRRPCDDEFVIEDPCF